VAFLWKNFKAGTADVEKLAKNGKLRGLAGFGEKSEQNILKAVEVFKKSTGRFHIDVAEAAALAIIEHIKKAGKAVESVTPAGSLRRGKETVGDLDLLVTLGEGHTSQKHVLYPRVDLAKGLLTAANALGGRAHQPRAISR
jgi:DNA polymerase (family 10)